MNSTFSTNEILVTMDRLAAFMEPIRLQCVVATTPVGLNDFPVEELSAKGWPTTIRTPLRATPVTKTGHPLALRPLLQPLNRRNLSAVIRES